MEVVEEKVSVERQWGEAEVLALMSVWDEVGAQHVAESRTTFELISERLRRLSVVRSWWECQAKCRSLGLQNRKPDAAAGTSANYSPAVDGRPVEGWEEEVEDVGNQRGIYPSSVTIPMQEGIKGRIHRALPYTPSVAEEGGRHWTDDEVRALLCVWADRRIRERLKCTLRNKSIFQEMARQMQRNFGVVRNWKQCRTKYKNLKYDFKTAKSAHAAGGSTAGGPGKYMKFFDEVEAILMDRGLDNGTMEMQKRLYDGELAAGRLQTPAGHTAQTTSSESEVVIEIDDDDNSDDYDMDGDMEAKWRGADINLTDPSSSDQFHVVTVSDTGRNWSDQEVRALIQVWSDERVCRQLESSTRKRDIFVQISNRGKTDEADPRRLMRFYDEVDAIMNRTTNGSPLATGPADHSVNSGGLVMLEGCEERDHVDVYMRKANTVTTMVGAMEERTCSSDSVSPISLDVAPSNEEPRLYTVKEHRLDQQHRLMDSSETRVEKEDTYSANRGIKRKAVDQDPKLQTKIKKLDTGSVFADNVEAKCKEEQDHIPIIKIKSVCSMASPYPSPERKVITTNKIMSNVTQPRRTVEIILEQAVGIRAATINGSKKNLKLYSFID
ncbi:uncharacterized protein LOC120791276 isoform X2 [Xiphias gladius]|uniref:uncharacterized protein LOC120791276 isoform X2 n=1 Tax=Xiphias gladius TaxID=8245 RepID=UPI001A9A07FC|nr:uncharacterized protein LOC120791276 isoform X2 [Xiphias gladius]